MLVLPFALALVIFMMSHPNKSLAMGLVFAFVSIGATRYITNLPLGLSVDLALAALIVSAMFHTNIKTDFSKLNNSLFLVTLIWMGYNVAEIFNPEARSVSAWIYAVRGTALYMFLTVPLTLLYANKPSDLNRLFIIVFSFA
ncbi:putative membrane protein [Cyclobacterium qasimii M12-11B]|uniref:Putative membrane protein n=2 Tax=Cyclobacterium qasimii TaxID=1350429 RepID=S7VME3_9BACT|nr:putative membrane protein [Cyclobacterium qasimii M12-11B]